MHRVGRHGKALISNGTRSISAAAEMDPLRKPPRWQSVIIPSRGDILKVQKTSSYSPDLSYLRKAPQLFAGKLANPNLQTRDVPREPPRELPDVAAITQRRREERLARMADQEARMADKAHRFNEAMRSLDKNAGRLNSLHPPLESPIPLIQLANAERRPLPLAHPAKVEIPDDQLSPLALKRREQRRLRESRARKPLKRFEMEGGDIVLDGSDINLDSVDSVEELEAISPTVHAPEFNGPEPIPKTIDDDFGIVQHHPFGNIAPLDGGDYSGYTSLSSSIGNSTSQTAVNAAEQVLSCQQDYNISQRKQTIDIVKTLVQ